MNQQRGPLLLILWAAILVSGGYASPIHQSDIHDDFAFHGTVAAYGSTGSTYPDNWLGGTGNWSDSWNWDSGQPSGSSDVYISSGGDDLVYLNMDATIASLTLGGAMGSSQLSSASTKNYLIIAGALTVNQTGILSLYSSDTVAAATLSVNAGTINLDGGSTLQIYGDASNSGSISVLDSSRLTVNGTFTNSGSLSAEWGPWAAAVNVGSLVNSGSIDLEFESNLQVQGDASNYGSMTLESGGLTVNGTLTNQGSLGVGVSGSASVGSLINSGTINLDGRSALQVSGDANNSGVITLGSSSGGNSFTVNGTLTNQGSLTLYASSATVGSLVNGGLIDLENSSGLQVNGDVQSGFILMNGSWLGVSGTVYNAGFALYDSGASVGGLVNGEVTLENASMQVNGDASVGSISMTQSSFGVGGSMGSGGPISMDYSSLTVGGELTNQGNFLIRSSSGVSVGSLINSGMIDLDYASALAVNGDATNSGSIYLGEEGSGRSLLSVNGVLTNHGRLEIDPAGAFPNTVNVGSLANDGTIDLTTNSVLHVNGDADNSGSISTGDFGYGYNALHIDGTLTNESLGSLVLSGYGDAAIIGSITNSGVIDLEGGSTLQVNRSVSNYGQISTSYYGNGGNTLTMPGMLTNNAGGTFSLGAAADVANVGRITNAGSISLASGATLTVSGASAPTTALPGFVNTGIVNIAPGSTLSTGLSYVQTAGETIVDGTLRAFGRVALVNFAGGSVYGNGTIQGPVMSNAAINLGDAPMTVGQMSFMGNYAQEANGSLTFDIAGAAPGQYDQLNVSGHATLNGLMTVDLLQGFVPQIGNMFDIMNFSGLSGTFSNLLGLPINGQEHFVLEYNATDLTLDVVSGGLLGADNDQAALLASVITSGIAPDGGSSKTSSITSHYGRSGQSSPTPEPGSLLLLGSGLLCVGYSIRQRMTK